MFIEDFDVVVDLCVEFLYMWVRKGKGAEVVSFNNLRVTVSMRLGLGM